jgi:outer membrane protein assembly factor BamD
MRLAKLLAVILIFSFPVGLVACGGGNKTSKLKASVNADEPRDGRDRELFEEALKEMKKKRYEQGRLLINTLVTTYGDSPLLPMAKLTIADSYYREGGNSNLGQAELEYKDWLQFFPNHELAPDVFVKMAEIHMRQIQTADRDKEHAFKAEKLLLDLQKRFPQTKDNPKVQEYLAVVEEKLAAHDLGVAKFYFERRDAWKATESRCSEIISKYPKFSELDTALWYLGRSLEEQEDTEEAAKHFARVVREFPDSKFRDAAAEKLELFGKVVPDPDPNAEERVVARQSMMGRMMETLFGPTLAVSKEGILLKAGDELDETTYQLIQNAARTDANAPQSISNSVNTDKSTNSTSISAPTTAPGSATIPKVKERKK